MKKVIRIILICLVIIIILVGCFLVYLTLKKDNNGNENENNLTSQQISDEQSEIPKKEVTNSAMYFSVKSCIEKYMSYISHQNAEAILKILDPTYIKEKNINAENLFEYVFKNENGEELNFDIEKMLVSGDTENLQSYYVKGYIRDAEGNKNESYIIVNIDMQALVFSIVPEVDKEAFNEEK